LAENIESNQLSAICLGKTWTIESNDKGKVVNLEKAARKTGLTLGALVSFVKVWGETEKALRGIN
jgi:hypothetical protein